ncbi:MAG: hypothetical protein QXS68_03075 [Candidatus Methanomethylicaceae archaeon]
MNGDDEKIKNALKFVAQDDLEDFDLQHIMQEWPKDPEAQQMVIALLSLRTARILKDLTRQVPRMWWAITLSVGIGVVALLLALNFNPIEAIAGALLAGGVSQIIRAISS